jgi:hypothetical protein
MKTLFALFVVTSVALFWGPGISMMGLQINDGESTLKTINLKIVEREEATTRYRTENGNDFSVSVENGKIVFMENDWLQQPSGTAPLFSNLTFGQTSLKDIRTLFGSNGYTYVRRENMTTGSDLVEFNCFEFDSSNNEVLVTITKASLDANLTEESIPENLKLDAIIIADKKYMDEIWGSKKVYDTGYRKINIQDL